MWWKCGKLTDFSNPNRNCISSGQCCVRLSKEVRLPPESWGQTSDISHRGGPATTRSPDITDPGGHVSFCLYSIQGGVSFQFSLICTAKTHFCHTLCRTVPGLFGLRCVLDVLCDRNDKKHTKQVATLEMMGEKHHLQSQC